MAIRRVLLPFLIVLIGVGVAAGLIATKPEAEKKPLDRGLMRVDVIRAQPGAHPVTVRGMGIVKPARDVVMMPLVSGRVVERSPHLVPGGLLAAGDMLIRVDGRDYAAALAAQEAALASAQTSLVEEQTRKSAAETEWGERSKTLDDTARRFALRETHVEGAQAGVLSARSQLKRARRDLKRTKLFAPFDAIVVDAPSEVGELVSTVTPVATLAAIDRYWVQVSIPVSQLSVLDIPDVNTNQPRGSAGTIVHDAGAGVRIERSGAVERLLGKVESRGRMAQLLVAVDDPLGIAAGPERASLPLLLDSHVTVSLQGRAVENAVSLPRTALHEGTQVWLVDDEDRLVRHTIELAWRERESVLVRGLPAGARVVTTAMASALDGTKVAPNVVQEKPAETDSPTRAGVAAAPSPDPNTGSAPGPSAG